MILRLARPEDLESLLQLAELLPPGMTSMPVDRPTWETKLAKVQQSIASDISGEEEAVYLLVLEDPETGELAGTAGIVAGVGLTRPFYNYRLSKEVKASSELNIRSISNLLHLNNDYTGATELVSLFLKPEYRHNGTGQLLSRCRYVFMRDFPERFSDLVFAEIRGWLDENSDSPFWRHLGQKFFNLPFEKADFISAVNGSQFISDLMPRAPVYVDLLPEVATDVIGKPHKDAEPAKRLLEREGFRFKGAIDIFDGGPVMECDRDSINSLRDTRAAVVAELGTLSDPETSSYIVSNCTLEQYRMIKTAVQVLPGQETPDSIEADEASPLQIVLDPASASALAVSPGDRLHILKMRQ